MKNLTLSIDEKVLEEARKYAADHSTTVNQMVRDFLSTHVNVRPRDRVSKVREGFAISDKAGANSGGWKFNREEIYAERLARYDKK